MSVVTTVRNWFNAKNVVATTPTPEQVKAHEEFTKAYKEERATLMAYYGPAIAKDLPVVKPKRIPFAEEVSEAAKRMAIAEAEARKAVAVYPWKFIETGIMAGGISLKNSDKFKSWVDQDKMMESHKQDTPIFFEAVQAHNKKISAERREKKNVVHTR